MTAEQALAALKTVRPRLDKTTREVVDLVLVGAEPTQEQVDAVGEECNRVWIESGRRSATTKRLAAYEAVEAYLADDYETAIRAAQFAQPKR